MKFHKLKSVEDLRRSGERVGRGTSSGYGKTFGRGQKGRLACQSGCIRPDFGGGQIPSFRIMSKRGFKNISRKECAIIDLDDPNKFENGSEVTTADLKAKGLVKKELSGVELLANDELKIKVTAKINKASKATEEAVNAADESVEVI